MTDDKAIDSVMVEAANILLRALQRDEATIGEKTKAFDSLTAYYAASLKGGKSADLPDNPSFRQLRDRIHAVRDDGEPAVSGS